MIHSTNRLNVVAVPVAVPVTPGGVTGDVTRRRVRSPAAGAALPWARGWQCERRREAHMRTTSRRRSAALAAGALVLLAAAGTDPVGLPCTTGATACTTGGGAYANPSESFKWVRQKLTDTENMVNGVVTWNTTPLPVCATELDRFGVPSLRVGRSNT